MLHSSGTSSFEVEHADPFVGGATILEVAEADLHWGLSGKPEVKTATFLHCGKIREMTEATTNESARSVPRRRELTAQVAAPMRRFLATETGGAGLMAGAAVLALLWANSPLSDSYFSLWGTELSIQLGGWEMAQDLRHWIDEALMAVFFFVIGLEVRRELSMGELSDLRRVALPVMGGIGGMVVPTAIYLAVSGGGELTNGWGIVIGTDTAFLLGALALVGPNIHTQLRVFLLTLSIVDDIVAITVIGAFYSGALNAPALAAAAACLVAIALLSHFRVRISAAYLAAGVALWLSTSLAGLHPTLAGMVAGLLVVAYPPRRDEVEEAAAHTRVFRQSPLPGLARRARRDVDHAISPNERFQASLHPITSYAIVPIFALANAGVDLRGGVLADALSSPLTWAIVAGLVVGKTIGIPLGTLGAMRVGWGDLPRGVGSGQVVAGGALSGIGFTVSLLIANLAFDDQRLVDEATVGILFAAIISVVVGRIAFWLAATLRGEVSAGLPTKLDPEVDPDRDHIRGPLDAPLTLVEYGDFECEFCGRATGAIRELRERFGDDLRYVFRNLALIDVHPHAELAAEAAEAAAAQGRYWEMHDLLFDRQGELGIDDLLEYAEDLDLDVERFAEDLELGRHNTKVRDDVASAEASGVTGTPTFFIGNRRHIGPHDTETLADALLAAQKRTAPG